MSSSSSSSSSPSYFPFSSDHPHVLSQSEQLCYVHCTLCDTVLAVSVPCSSLFKTVTVRCGHCTSLLVVNMHGFLLPSTNQMHIDNDLLEEIRSSPAGLEMDKAANNEVVVIPIDETPNPPPVNRPPEKRQRVPSAYNRFIKDEIQRIKAGNPNISHRDAFSAAAKNWAHFPHIHCGLMPDQPFKKAFVYQQQEVEDVLGKDGFFSPSTMSVTHY